MTNKVSNLQTGFQWANINKPSTIYLITGANGNLARHIIYQLTENHADDIERLQIIALFHKSIEQLDSLLEENLLYPKGKKIAKETLRKIFLPLKFELTDGNLGLSDAELSFLTRLDIDYFIHNAAGSDFRRTSSVARKMQLINVQGTENVLSLCKKLKIGYFCYTSSAYVCGRKYGLIQSDDNDHAEFNNYYEETKFIADRKIDEFCKANNIRFCNFRISSISGRLIHEPIGYTTKCDLFVAWALFFYKFKERIGTAPDQELTLPIRIFAKDYGLNIVPVDYTAKLLTAIINQKGSELSCVHITNPRNINHKEYLAAILDRLNISGYQFVDEAPDPSTYSEIESSYYKILDPIFNDYLTKGEWDFDLSNIQENFAEIIETCRPRDVEDFKELLEYPIAIQFKF
jgi:nucleoside-diphosphate-sugar epimerase